MTSCSKSDVRRCRPLLGTFVEIAVGGLDEISAWQAVDAAFAAVENIHRLMSVQDETSELSLLNREANSYPVKVSRPTFTVLRRALEISAESDGAFDCTVASTLADWGMLPARLCRRNPGNWRDVLLLPGRKVCFLQPLALDLGGIAKGFAVDEAIQVLRAAGATSAIVNAGGDLRVFGPEAVTVHLRHPAQPQRFAYRISLNQSALATSSPYFTERSWRDRTVSHLVNSTLPMLEDGYSQASRVTLPMNPPLRLVGTRSTRVPILEQQVVSTSSPRPSPPSFVRRRGRNAAASREQAVTGPVSVSVRAPECWLADALTKVVLNAPRRAETLLAKYNAEAFMLST